MSYLAKLKAAGPQNGDELLKKLDKSNNYAKRTTFWSVTRDKTGKGSATIRWLPAVEGEDEPLIELYHHAFKDDETGNWYIENSRTTLGDRDPLSEYNQYIYRKGEKENNEELKKLVSKRKRTHYRIGNIVVLKDPGEPANEDKVHLYRFGTRVYDKIKAAMKPEFEGIEPIPVFDLWHGSNFNIRVALDSNKIPQYDQSTFDANPSALYGGDIPVLEKLMSAATPLQSLLAPDQFKSYDELSERLEKVIGDPYIAWLDEKATKPSTNTRAKPAEATGNVVVNAAPSSDVPWEANETPPKTKPKAKKAEPKPAETTGAVVDDETEKLFGDLSDLIGKI